MTGLVSAGELNRLISLQAPQESRGSNGEVLVTWVPIKNVWARIEAAGGRELMAAQAEQVQVSHRITLRYDAVLASPRSVAAYRAVYGARIFNFTASMNIDEANSVVDVLAHEGLNNGQ